MEEPGGLRERKKRLTRQRIAKAAARLFAEDGYEGVSVGDIARAADVSPQTVYNYFPSKGDLVTDLDGFVQDRLGQLIRARAPDCSPARAIRSFVMEIVALGEEISPEEWPGEIGNLALDSPAVRRLALEMIDRQAAVVADAILETSDVDPAVARLQGIAVAGVFQVMLDESGRLTHDGETQPRIAALMTPLMERALDELEAWFEASTAASQVSRGA